MRRHYFISSCAKLGLVTKCGNWLYWLNLWLVVIILLCFISKGGQLETGSHVADFGRHPSLGLTVWPFDRQPQIKALGPVDGRSTVQSIFRQGTARRVMGTCYFHLFSCIWGVKRGATQLCCSFYSVPQGCARIAGLALAPSFCPQVCRLNLSMTAPGGSSLLFGGSELFDVLSMEAFEIPVRMLELFGSSFSDMCCKVVHWFTDNNRLIDDYRL